MSDDDDPQLDLFHARRSDPQTSHDAALSTPITKQCRRVLEAYRFGQPLLDCEAYRLVGFAPGRTSHQRCSDLRAKRLIVRLEEKRKTFNGKPGHVCRITQFGLAYLQSNP